ncbi:YciI family protein [Roseomonas sp. CCTCC AB2023176]|uniref:YciI family protein n=1 Tax=Roseomonas sp. CCTCC AB2023176 TaxID=3342640 RepID=UPI0035DBDAA3
MRFMLIVKATPESEAGAMPEPGLAEAMMAFNQQMVDAGVMKAGEGVHPSSRGARVHFSAEGTRVERGPFPWQGLLAGFWMIECASLEDAIGWARRAPAPMGQGKPAEIEVRQILTFEDFGDAITPEVRAQESAMRAALGDG